MERVEVETQPGQQRRGRGDGEEGDRDHRHPAPDQKPVDRRQGRKSHRPLFGARLQHREQRRQQRNAEQEGDQHAAAGDLAELRQPPIVGRDKRGKPDRGRRCGEGQWQAGLFCRPDQGRAQLAQVVPLGAIAHAELDAEIDAETDKQHKKCDRDQVQRADHQQSGGGRNRKPGGDAQHHRQDDPRRAQGQPKDDPDRRQGQHGVEPGMVLDAGELVVVDRHEAGQMEPHLVLPGEVELPRRRGDRLRRRQARLQRFEIELWLDFDKAPELVRLDGAAGRQPLPGKARGPAGERRRRDVGSLVHRRRQIVERQGPGLDPRQPEREGIEGAAQARVGAQRREQRAGLGETARQPRNLVSWQIKQAVAFEEPAALRLVDGADHIFARNERRTEPVGRLGGIFGGRRIDDGDDARFRERPHIAEGSLRPRQARRKQRLHVGRQSEISCRIDGRRDSQEHGNSDHPPGPARAQTNQADDRGFQHAVARCRPKLLAQRAPIAKQRAPLCVR